MSCLVFEFVFSSGNTWDVKIAGTKFFLRKIGDAFFIISALEVFLHLQWHSQIILDSQYYVLRKAEYFNGFPTSCLVSIITKCYYYSGTQYKIKKESIISLASFILWLGKGMF